VKILVVDPDGRRAPTFRDALMVGGADVTVASSGSFALTMLEWNRHDVVVCQARIDDMDGHELCSILKADPGTRDVRFVLVAGVDDVSAAETTAAGVDLVLPPTLAGSAILPLIVRLMQADRASAGEPAPSAPPGDAVPAPPASTPAAAASVPEPVAAPGPAAGDPAPAAPSIPRIRPEAPPPPPADPPKRYATAGTVDTQGPWSTTSPAPVPGQPVAKLSATPPPPAPRPGPAPSVKPGPAPSAARGAAPGPGRGAATTPAKGPAPGAPRPAPTAPSSSPPRAQAPAGAAPPPRTEDLLAIPSGTFQGSMEVMEFADLTQAIAGGGKSGRLILALPQGGGLILFEKGRVVHAEYRNTVGEEAFGALLAACHADGAGRFCFLPSAAGEASGLPRTIDKTVDRLLLSSATAIDEKG
jgi:CheY-like chemotaxis protein